MKNIVNWIIEVEDGTRRFYESAARRFADNQALSSLLRSLALDERHHYESVLGAYEILKEHDVKSPVSFDDGTKDAIIESITEAQKRLDAGGFTEVSLMEKIVDIEFSECNEAFLCVINALKPYKGIHESAKLHIGLHTDKIMAALQDRPEYAHLIERIESIKKLEGNRLLIIDDEEIIRDVLIAIFSDRYAVETASSGAEALAKIGEGPLFDAVICDLNMPGMDGIEFYKKVLERSPATAERVIFLAGLYEKHHSEYLMKNSLKHIMKPVSIKELKGLVSAISDK